MKTKKDTKICKTDMTHLNSYRSNELQTSFTGTRQLLEDISSATMFPTLNGISDTEAQKPSMFCEETLKGLFGYNSTITLHLLKVNNSEHKAFLQYAQGKRPEQMIQEQFADNAHRMVEMRESAGTSPHTRLTAATDNLHAVTPQNIEINRTEKKYDVAQILERLTTLAELKRTLESEVNCV